jgi:putative acetyltransferase
MRAEGCVAVADPHDAEVQALLARHLAFTRTQTPQEHSYALDLDGLVDPSITLFGYRYGGALLGIAAIKWLSTEHAEIKSMHTAQEARGLGIGRAMLVHLLDASRAAGMRRLSLETGTTDAYWPARRLYESAGFVPCGPYGDYEPSPHNLFMTRDLAVQISDVA